MRNAPAGPSATVTFAPLRQLLDRWLPSPSSAGDRGEQLAAGWLKRERGFAIVTRNWRNPRDRRDEIDLVCRDGDVLVFVEVKTRAAGALVPGYFAVDERKKRVLRRTIDAYLRALDAPPRTFRCDVVEVALPADGGAPEILHFENIALFSKHYRG